MKAFASALVEAAFAEYPHGVRKRLLSLRELILRMAARTAGVGELEETLKWGEPAYLTTATKSGSTIRLGVVRGARSHAAPAAGKAASTAAMPTAMRYAMYFNCNTTLIDTFRTIFPDLLYEGNRAILFDEKNTLPARELERCIAMALTYHQDKRARASRSKKQASGKSR